MMIKKFISEHDVDFSVNLINADTLKYAENTTGLKFGPQLRKYLLEYGYLGFESVEFYGINSRQMMNSDMITQTEYLHKYYDVTKQYMALENSGEGDYILIDTDDNIYEYISEENKIIPCNLKMFDYILKRFESVTIK